MKLRFYLLLTLIVLFSACSAEEIIQTENNWYSNLEEAMDEAKIWKRPIFVDFTGSDWCGWCIKLDEEVFSQPEFSDYAANNLILVKLDFPQKKQQSNETKQYNNNLAQKYGIRGFPTIVLLDESGKEITRTGYIPGGAAQYVEHLKQLLGQE